MKPIVNSLHLRCSLVLESSAEMMELVTCSAESTVPSPPSDYYYILYRDLDQVLNLQLLSKVDDLAYMYVDGIGSVCGSEQCPLQLCCIV